MEYAVDRRTDNLTHAPKAVRDHSFLCPLCLADAFLRAGRVREPHFAHNKGQAPVNCENYHPGTGSTSSVRRRRYAPWHLYRPPGGKNWAAVSHAQSGMPVPEGHAGCRETWGLHLRSAAVCFVRRGNTYRLIDEPIVGVKEESVILADPPNEPPARSRVISSTGTVSFGGRTRRAWIIGSRTTPSPADRQWLESIGMSIRGGFSPLDPMLPAPRYTSDDQPAIGAGTRGVLWRLPRGLCEIAMDLPGGDYEFQRIPDGAANGSYLSITSAEPGTIEVRARGGYPIVQTRFGRDESFTATAPPRWSVKAGKTVITPGAAAPTELRAGAAARLASAPGMRFDARITSGDEPDILVASGLAHEVNGVLSSNDWTAADIEAGPFGRISLTRRANRATSPRPGPRRPSQEPPAPNRAPPESPAPPAENTNSADWFTTFGRISRTMNHWQLPGR